MKVSWCKFVDCESTWSRLTETAAGDVASRLHEHEHCFSELRVWALTAPAHSLCSQPDNCAGVPPPRLDPPPACPSIAPGLINLRPAIAHRFRKQTACLPRFFSMACPDLPLRLRKMRAPLTHACSLREPFSCIGDGNYIPYRNLFRTSVRLSFWSPLYLRIVIYNIWLSYNTPKTKLYEYFTIFWEPIILHFCSLR